MAICLAPPKFEHPSNCVKGNYVTGTLTGRISGLAEGLMEMCRADRTTPGRQLAGARIYGVPAFCSRKADEREWRGTGVQVSCAAETLVGPHQRPGGGRGLAGMRIPAKKKRRVAQSSKSGIARERLGQAGFGAEPQ